MDNEVTRVMQLRAVTTEQKRDMIMRLLGAWLNAPNLRLGQLIMNGLYSSEQSEDLKRFLFNVEDEVLVSLLESHFPDGK